MEPHEGTGASVVHSLIYASTATVAITGDVLVDLVTVARERNAAADVTGHLLYTDGSFLQELEGPEAAVEAIYASIERDARHRDIHLLGRRARQGRDFPDWQLSLVRVSSRLLRELHLPAGQTRAFDPTGDLRAPLAEHLRSYALAAQLLRYEPPVAGELGLTTAREHDGTNWVFLRA